MREVYLSEILKERLERAGQAQLSVLSVSNKHGFVSPQDIFNKVIASSDTKNYKRVLPGDFAYNPSRINIGSIALNQLSRTGIVSPMYSVFYIEDQNKLDSKYLLYFLKSPRGQFLINHGTQGGVRSQLKYSKLLKIKIPLPDISVQKNIVSSLEELEVLKEKRTAANQLLSDLIPAIFIKEFASSKKSNQKWAEGPLSDLVNIVGGGTPSTKKELFWNGDIPWVSPKDMIDITVNDAQDHVTVEAIENSSTSLVPTNSILVVTRSGILKHSLPLAIVTQDVTINQDIKALVIKDKNILNVDFLFWQLMTRVKEILRFVKHGATVESLSTDILKTLLITVPPIELQNNFAEKINEIKSFGLQQKLSEANLQELSYALFSIAYEESNVNKVTSQESILSPIKIFPIQQAIGITLRRGFERGEMVIDKVLYLAQEIYKVPLSIPFTPYKLGPWSIKVKDAVNGGMSKKSQFFKRKKIGPASVLTLNNNADKLFTQYSNARVLQDMEAALDQLLPIIKYSKSSEIECLATACKVIQDNKTIDSIKVFQKVNAWKPNKFNKEELNKALRIVLQQNWDKILLS